jgi:hypothetical protein
MLHNFLLYCCVPLDLLLRLESFETQIGFKFKAAWILKIRQGISILYIGHGPNPPRPAQLAPFFSIFQMAQSVSFSKSHETHNQPNSPCPGPSPRTRIPSPGVLPAAAIRHAILMCPRYAVVACPSRDPVHESWWRRTPPQS